MVSACGFAVCDDDAGPRLRRIYAEVFNSSKLRSDPSCVVSPATRCVPKKQITSVIAIVGVVAIGAVAAVVDINPIVPVVVAFTALVAVLIVIVVIVTRATVRSLVQL